MNELTLAYLRQALGVRNKLLYLRVIAKGNNLIELQGPFESVEEATTQFRKEGEQLVEAGFECCPAWLVPVQGFQIWPVEATSPIPPQPEL